MIDKVWTLFLVVIIYLATVLEVEPFWWLHFIVLAQFVRHTRRNPQKSQAEPVPDQKKIIKEGKALDKGASGSCKPEQSPIPLQERPVIEQIYVWSIPSNTSSEENIL